MKKFIFALGLLVALSSCGGSATTEAVSTTDSTTVSVDTTKVDTAAVKTPTVSVDSTK